MPLSFPPDWRTETVRALAHGIRTDGAFDRMPILADALEEAGCDDPRVLNHCRFCERHRPDCWVIEQIVPLDGLHWTGEMRDRLAAAVAAAASRGHPADATPESVPIPEPSAAQVTPFQRVERASETTLRVIVWVTVAAVFGLPLLGAVVAVIQFFVPSFLGPKPSSPSTGGWQPESPPSFQWKP